MSLSAGAGGRSALLAVTTLVGQASVGWANDFVDADRDRFVGRLDKPIVEGVVGRDTVGVAAAVALAAVVPTSLALGWRAGAAHLVAVGAAWLYNLRLKETPASVAPYALAFGLLPVVLATALPGAPLPQPLLVATAGCLGIAAHFANTVGDSDEDARTGVRGLPQRVGPRISLTVAAGFVTLAAVLLVAATNRSPASLVASGVAVASLPLALRTPRHRRTPFLAVLAAAGALVVAFVLAGGDHLTSR
jgi:4-hydroxybenzoate polyprenyltransferase